MTINKYNISDHLVTNLIIVYILILSCPDYTRKYFFRKYMFVAPELQHFADRTHSNIFWLYFTLYKQLLPYCVPTR